MAKEAATFGEKTHFEVENNSNEYTRCSYLDEITLEYNKL